MLDCSKVKKVGRTYFYKGSLWLALSGSGVEFEFEGKKLSVTMLGDNIAIDKSSESSRARIGIFVDDELVVSDCLSEAKKSYVVFESDDEVSKNIKIVKLSEAPMSTVGISSIDTNLGGKIKPAKNKKYKIEFIGDSITCGYGIEVEDPTVEFCTANENVTKAYAYKTVKALDVDYSMVSYSGYGIISGYTDTGDKLESQLLPEYYEKVGFSRGYFNGEIEVQSLNWNFNEFKPDLIVINLGTNDYSYCLNYEDRKNEFRDEYVNFLKQVRRNNNDSKILCTLGIMGDDLFYKIEEAVKIYSNETGDKDIETMKFDVQLESDGYVSDYHPTELTHSKAAMKLIEKIKEFI